MTDKWPVFATHDLGEGDDAEMQRRWTVYRDEMRALIAKGGVHQDKDGWWVDDASGDLIGPDPDIERPSTADEARKAVAFTDAFPALAESVRHRGAQKTPTKVSTTIRLSPDVIDHFRASGKGWQARIDDALREYIANH